MITVSIKRLLDAIEEADSFKLPDMSAGADYVYNKVYKRLAHNMDVRLSGINFDKFELDDVDTIRALYTDVLEDNFFKSERMSNNFRSLPPVVRTTAFV
jgi:hypothetical protein